MTKFRNFVTGGSISHKVPKNLEFGENSYLKWQFYSKWVQDFGVLVCLHVQLSAGGQPALRYLENDHASEMVRTRTIPSEM